MAGTGMAKIRTAVLPVAGFGTRFLPATRAIPKELLPIVDRPVVHYALDEAQAAGIERFVFITARGKSVIEDHFDRNAMLEHFLQQAGKPELVEQCLVDVPEPGVIAYVRQGHPNGLGHAILSARHAVGDEPFAVLLPDDFILGPRPALATLVETRSRLGSGSFIGVKEVDPLEAHRYGIIRPGGEPESSGAIPMRGMVEKPDPESAPSRLAAVGRYVLEPEVFEVLARQELGVDGEIQLTDALDEMAREGQSWAVPLEGERFDCGSKIGLLKANVVQALKDPDLGPRLREFLRSLDCL